MAKPVILTAERIERTLFNLGVDVYNPAIKVLLSDATYASPTRRWVGGPFSESLEKILASAVLNYDAESWDCDDFSRLTAVLAQVFHARTNARPKGTGLAFGEVWFWRQDGVFHAVNIVLVYEKGDFKVLFYEPQTRKFFEMSRGEIASIRFVRF